MGTALNAERDGSIRRCAHSFITCLWSAATSSGARTRIGYAGALLIDGMVGVSITALYPCAYPSFVEKRRRCLPHIASIFLSASGPCSGLTWILVMTSSELNSVGGGTICGSAMKRAKGERSGIRIDFREGLRTLIQTVPVLSGRTRHGDSRTPRSPYCGSLRGSTATSY